MKLPLTPIRFLRYAHEQFPDKVGVVCGEQRFTYSQFAERAHRLAGALIAGGAAILNLNRHSETAAPSGDECARQSMGTLGELRVSKALLPHTTPTLSGNCSRA